MEIVFIVLLCGIVYTYLGYPLLLIVLTVGKNQTAPHQVEDLPQVSLIISAHNEKAVIESKILNSLEFDYPCERYEIIVVSDGSTDETPAIVKRFGNRGVRLIEFHEHVGKTAGQNEAVRQATGEFLVFSDANSMFERSAVKELIAVFSDKRVGCVCGELRYRNSGDSSVGKSESAYWKYEQFCKKRESMLGSLLGVNGAIYSIRRECFIELNSDIISDFILPMKIYSGGWEIRYCAGAVAFENTTQSYGDEFRRKKRIIVRSLNGLFKHIHFLNPLSNGFFSLEIWSHKLIRWFVPFMLIGLFWTNLMLVQQPVFFYIFIAQVLFYLLALIGLTGGERARSSSFINIPYYFLIINCAALIAIIEYVMGERYQTWSTVRS